MARNRKLETTDDYMKAYPHVTAAVIAFSLGYATPTCAANIVKDAHTRQGNFCEWIYECYRTDPLPAVQSAIRGRHRLKGYMADYSQALELVRHAVKGGEEPKFASWF